MIHKSTMLTKEEIEDAVNQSLEASIRRAELEAQLGKPVFTLSKEELETIRKGADKDSINPDHYKSSTSLECIEAMELVFGKTAVLNFCMCNAWKYIWRWKHKNGVEDLNKAKWYIEKATKLDPFSYDVILERMLAYINVNNCPEEDGDK